MALPMKNAMKVMKSSAMKAKTSMKAKAMKVMKKKAVSKIAMGKRAKSVVFRGSKEKTSGGLAKSQLMKNKRGKVVSKKMHAKGKTIQKFVQRWLDSVMTARKELGIKGFCAVGGKSAQGKALYAKAKVSQSRLPAEFNLLSQFEKHMQADCRELQRARITAGWTYKPDRIRAVTSVAPRPLRCEGLFEKKNPVGPGSQPVISASPALCRLAEFGLRGGRDGALKGRRLVGYVQPLVQDTVTQVACFAVAASAGTLSEEGPVPPDHTQKVTCLSAAHLFLCCKRNRVDKDKDGTRAQPDLMSIIVCRAGNAVVVMIKVICIIVAITFTIVITDTSLSLLATAVLITITITIIITITITMTTTITIITVTIITNAIITIIIIILLILLILLMLLLLLLLILMPLILFILIAIFTISSIIIISSFILILILLFIISIISIIIIIIIIIIITSSFIIIVIIIIIIIISTTIIIMIVAPSSSSWTIPSSPTGFILASTKLDSSKFGLRRRSKDGKPLFGFTMNGALAVLGKLSARFSIAACSCQTAANPAVCTFEEARGADLRRKPATAVMDVIGVFMFIINRSYGQQVLARRMKHQESPVDSEAVFIGLSGKRSTPCERL
ncbi:hypothetical protein AK812_SmicGene35089 [Symbiodinium microadriaticum]|uniref:Uncharacterized protein n=1 Tax=Symbiodinium microadriaticum TaxID=2951 RepID=A0A1Q9CMB7_SYMMI|nr:hypothetical protein AK812_SmicGene35089 [Symbiodinium microadriaticum]